MLGLPYGKVFLVPWTEEWAIEFVKRNNSLRNKLANIF